jgi:hypothetical protein
MRKGRYACLGRMPKATTLCIVIGKYMMQCIDFLLSVNKQCLCLDSFYSLGFTLDRSFESYFNDQLSKFQIRVVRNRA